MVEVQLVATMIPALSAEFGRGFGINSVRTVPAIPASISTADRTVSLIATVDTGAEISVLDKSFLPDLAAKAIGTEGINVVRATSEPVELYLLDVRLGSQSSDDFLFPGVPIVVMNLNRPVLLLGRQGILEWLKLEVDYPAGKLTLTRSKETAQKYAEVAAVLPSLELGEADLIKDIEGTVIRSYLELEQFTDKILLSRSAENPDFSIEVGSPSLRRKLYTLLAQKPKHVHDDINAVVSIRNQVVHSTSLSMGTTDLTKYLESLDRLATELKSIAPLRIEVLDSVVLPVRSQRVLWDQMLRDFRVSNFDVELADQLATEKARHAGISFPHRASYVRVPIAGIKDDIQVFKARFKITDADFYIVVRFIDQDRRERVAQILGWFDANSAKEAKANIKKLIGNA